MEEHNNLGLAIGNSPAAIAAGATAIDGSTRGLGTGSGNTQTEVLVAVLIRMGMETGINPFKIMDTAEYIVDAIMVYPFLINRDALTIGFTGVYSTFLMHAKRAAEKFDVDPREILLELGRRKAVAGQEDWILDVASLQLAAYLYKLERIQRLNTTIEPGFRHEQSLYGMLLIGEGDGEIIVNGSRYSLVL